MATGRFQFISTDMVNYPPGTYLVQITATSGAKSESFILKVILENPCETVDLNLQPSPFSDQTYVIRDPPFELPW